MNKIQISQLCLLVASVGCVAPTPGEVTVSEVAQGCFVEQFRQPDADLAPTKLDVLFVSDTSGSLLTERTAIANELDSFVAELPANTDYRVSLMLAHGSRGSQSGKLWAKSGRGPVLDSKLQSLAQIREDLKYLASNTVSDSYSDGGEEGLFSLKRALDPTLLATNRAKGFFREDAALAVIFIADENDICARYPAGVTRVPDPENSEAPAYTRDCANVTPESVHARVKELMGDRPFVIAGIVYNNHATYPRDGENEYGYGYLELIGLAGGLSVDLAGNNFGHGLSSIGNLVARTVTLKTVFTLARENVDSSTIHASVDGETSGHIYSEDNNEVTMTEPGRPGSTVEIAYCQRREPAPSPTPTPSASPSPTPTPSASPSPTPTPSASPSPTPTPSASPSPSPAPCEGPGCGGGVIGV